MWGKIEYIDLYISIRFKGKQIFYCNKMDILLKSNKLSPRQVERIKKCMYQAFYLLQTIYNDEENITLKITGSTLNVYEIKITNRIFICNCPDFQQCQKSGILCKHICFVICIIGKIYTEDLFHTNKLSVEEMNQLYKRLNDNCDNDPNIINNMFIKKFMEINICNTTTRNIDEDCVVCYSPLKDTNVIELYKCKECLNAIHKKCYDMWILYHKNCVFCRTTITEDTDKYLNISTR